MSNIANKSTAEFVSSREGLAEIVGSPLDDAQYISLLLSTNSERTNGKIGLGNISIPGGRRYRLSVSGIPVATNHKGLPVVAPEELKHFLNAVPSRENELHYDSLAHFEVERETRTGKRYLGVFFSIADACKYMYDEAEKGEL